MYKIKCEDLTLYNPFKKDLVLGDPTLNLEVNKAGSLSFTMYPTHTYYGSIRKMKSVISVYRDDKILFKGRVYSDKVNFYKIKTVEVEGLLAYFNDSIVRPYVFTGTPEEYLAFLVDQHNGQVEEFQKFKLGVVTVTDPNDYITRSSSASPNTWAEIEEKLIKLLGGYIRIRYEEDGNYIDYIEDYSDVSTQQIKFSVNLQDLENEVRGDSLATCIIPYGAKLSDLEKEETPEEETEEETEEEIETVDETSESTEETTETDARVTIKSVNNGLDYIQDDTAVAIYGKIYEVVTWDDVTEPENLLTKARAYLATSINLSNALTIKAIDLHLADKDIEAFNLGDYIEVYSVPHSIEETLLLTAYTIKLADPSGCIFSLGKVSSGFMDNQISSDRENSDNFTRIDIVEKEIGETNTTLEKTTQETLTFVNQSIENSEETTRTMLKEYAKTSDLEELNESVSTTFTQTAEDFNFKFETVNERITNENGEIVTEIETIQKYIRFVDGSIILGSSENEITLTIKNDVIIFEKNGIEFGWWDGIDFHTGNIVVEVNERAQFGNFAFIPRSDNSLMFLNVGKPLSLSRVGSAIVGEDRVS